MAKVAIVGAGVMGSALAIPLADNGHQVALVGTDFDREVISQLLDDGWHPALQSTMPPSVRAFYFEDLEEGIHGAKSVVIGVISSAVRDITRKLAPFLQPEMIIVNIAKGLEVKEDGQFLTMPQVITAALPEELMDRVAVVAIGGPSKALELASRHPTSVVFASEQEDALGRCAQLFATDYYDVHLTTDSQGVEVCAAVKNGYAIAVGMCDGIEKSSAVTDTTMDNLRAAIFTQAIAELAELVHILDGQVETAYGLAGLGDFYVTCQQGRNLDLGRLLGEGLAFAEAIEAMRGATVEGIEAVRMAYRLTVARLTPEELRRKFPLLEVLQSVLFAQSSASLLMDRFYGSGP